MGRNEERMWTGGARVVMAEVICDTEMEASNNESKTSEEEVSLSSF